MQEEEVVDECRMADTGSGGSNGQEVDRHGKQLLPAASEISCTRVRFIKLHAIATAWMVLVTGQSVYS